MGFYSPDIRETGYVQDVLEIIFFFNLNDVQSRSKVVSHPLQTFPRTRVT